MCRCLGPGLLRAIEFLEVGPKHWHYFKIPLGDSNVQPGSEKLEIATSVGKQSNQIKLIGIKE